MQKIAFKKNVCVFYQMNSMYKRRKQAKINCINIVVFTFYLILKCIPYAKLKTEYSNFVYTKVHYPFKNIIKKYIFMVTENQKKHQFKK